MKLLLVGHLRSGPKIYQRFRHDKVFREVIKDITLTPEEENFIDNLELFKKPLAAKPKRRTVSQKQIYLDSKLEKVKSFFNDASHPDYFKYTLPTNNSNPYLDALARRTIDKTTNKIEYKGNKRLSVTKLLTKRWCELRETYDIYSNIPIFTSHRVTGGKKEHSTLENKSHPTALEIEEFIEGFELPQPQGPFPTLVDQWFSSLGRICELFIKGEAREVLCHGYLNFESSKLVTTNIHEESDVLVSGVIDHLFFVKKRDQNTEDQEPYNNFKFQGFKNEIFDSITMDMNEVIKYLENNIDTMGESYIIITSDVKTRPIYQIPSQTSVLKYTKIQIMYYRYLLKQLGKNKTDTYYMLLENARRRGLDINQNIEPATLIPIMMSSDLFLSDCRKLRDGQELDGAIIETTPGIDQDGLDWGEYKDLISDNRVLHRLDEFFVKWKRPMTLKYLADRLSHLYFYTSKLLSKKLLIEYYCRGQNFHNVEFLFDAKTLENEIDSSSRFWFGKRQIEPIEPTLENFTTYCGACDYKDVCLWRKEGLDNLKNLGNELVSIDKNN